MEVCPMPSKYSPEFKQDAVKLAVESDQPISQTARALGVNPNTLYTWVAKYHQPQTVDEEGAGDKHPYEELKRLRREIAQLKEERDILKKAAAYFAKNSR
jgi:transposase